MTYPIARPIVQITKGLDALRDFVDVLDSFLQDEQMKSAKANAPVFAPLLVAMQEAQELPPSFKMPEMSDQLRAYVKERYPIAENIKVESTGTGITITLPTPEGASVHAAIRETLSLGQRSQILYSSSLTTLTNAVELFFSRLLHEYFTLHPEAIGTKDKLFSFEDLSRFDSIADARAHYVLDKIENLLRGTLADWLKFARESLKLSMGYLKEDLALLEETFQRRNLIVHNGGIVNSIYLSRTPAEVRHGVAVGDDLSPSRAYLSMSIDRWETTCVLIGAELWKQLAPTDEERATHLGIVAYEHLVKARWNVAEAISKFMILDKGVSETARLNAQLNLWQCRKRRGAWESVKDEVLSCDFSTKSGRYQLPLLALQDKADEFFERLPRALKAEELSKEELRDWPIFTDMRGDPRFAKFSAKPAKTTKTTRRRRPASGRSPTAVPNTDQPPERDDA